MQLSDAEYIRVSHAWLMGGSANAVGRDNTMTAISPRVLPQNLQRSESADLDRVLDAITQQSDVRETIVSSLRSRIESGEYNVSGEQIAEMMVRRLLSDTIR